MLRCYSPTVNIEAGDNGIVVYEIHQSDINTYLTCPERARYLWKVGLEDGQTDSAAVGTAVHAAIERYLKGYGYDLALEDGYHTFNKLAEEPGFRYVKNKYDSTCLRHVHTAFDAWVDKVYPTLGNPLVVEEEFRIFWGVFEVPVLQPTGECTFIEVHVYIAGIMDYVDELGVADWKVTTHSYKYEGGFGGEGWKQKRWAIQPTMYTYAATQLGLIEPQNGAVPFEFVALHPTTGAVTRLALERSEADWAWLGELLWNVVEMHSAPLAHWPLNDQHALCSPDWCPAWSQCKGVYIPTVALAA